MGAQEAKRNSVHRKKGAKIMVKEFSSIITLNTFNDDMKLSFDISKKALQGKRGVGFFLRGKVHE
jgi:hypothetical protein